jgi:hypothetical protein
LVQVAGNAISTYVVIRGKGGFADNPNVKIRLLHGTFRTIVAANDLILANEQ